ncbi:GNAT family N-acetyltransferase [Paracoccus sp. MBLB3053]|uniref:GNAT family N-acetyltransferase n=1 Tax=Paracoccus aurantius TaxID=3073814 RepID=A0ABU2HV96_9RHOB|nr:GNAT family N-acetyltransferase [Paracoccus sp. MBLB3053]MDS9468970.1 GNAT family N-acetyltransferase [Paracoccus sp. MBLB3053]
MEFSESRLIPIGERAEISAWESVWSLAPKNTREQLGLSWARSGDGAIALHASGFGWWFFNRVLGIGLTGVGDTLWLDGELDRFEAAGQPYGVSFCSELVPRGFADHLAGRGLRHQNTLAKMIRRSDDLPLRGPDRDIREIGPEDMALFVQTLRQGFGVPATLDDLFATLPGEKGWHCYLGYDKGRPVATGALYHAADTAWLGFGSVVPDSRRSGMHRAMMLFRMQAAAEMGCRWLVTETNRPEGDEPAPSYRNMESLGFTPAYFRPNHIRAA